LNRSTLVGAILKLVISILIAIAVGTLIFAIASNPLRKSDADVRAWLLAKTPLSSSSNDVRSAIEKRGWYTDGYRTTQPRPATDPFIAGDLGGYHGLPWYVFVSAFWEFDGSNRLAGIRIQRIIDSP
jgi:hypothetical protein